MSTIAITAPEGVRLDVTIERQVERQQQVQTIVESTRKLTMVDGEGHTLDADVTVPSLKVTTETVQVWEPQSVSSFATDRREFTLGPGERLVVTEGK